MSFNSGTTRWQLNEAGFKYLNPLQKPLLTQHHLNICLSWTRSVVSHNWNHMVVSNEIIFRAHQVRKYFFQRPDERKVCRTIKYSVKIDPWACLSNDDLGRIVSFKNNLTRSLVCNNIYRYVILPTACEHFARSQHWHLLEDWFQTWS